MERFTADTSLLITAVANVMAMTRWPQDRFAPHLPREIIRAACRMREGWADAVL